MNAVSIIRSKAVAVVSVGVLGAGLLGGVAFAMTPSSADYTTTMAPSGPAGAASAAPAQREKRHPKIKEFVGDVLKASVDYLGLSADQVKKDLRAGKSLGQIANNTPGKSRDGLLKTLDSAAAKRIDAAVDAGKITKEQAEQLRTKVGEAIVRIVDHTK